MRTRSRTRPSFAIGLVAVAALAWRAPAADPSPEDVRFFETKVRPLLADKCFKCHGPEKQKGGLRLDSAEAVKTGGDSGSSLLTPGKPDESLLLRAVRHADGVEKMPPNEKLKDAEIADLAAWVKRGAPFPAAAKAVGSDPAKHWAFQPVVRPQLPEHDARITNPIDAFVLAKLEAAGLKPAPPADRRTLIRRATFDLTGLPPTPEEVEAFLADESPDAFAKVVDRLLASPAYGERWGRHWLDVARYADSNGLDENVAYGNAWRYRDYVIDELQRRQAVRPVPPRAGRRRPAARRRRGRADEQLIATGFLALGPKVLAEVDEKKMEMDIVDEQIDTLGRAVLGLTLGCARCHDHKFDPVDHGRLLRPGRRLRQHEDDGALQEGRPVARELPRDARRAEAEGRARRGGREAQGRNQGTGRQARRRFQSGAEETSDGTRGAGEGRAGAAVRDGRRGGEADRRAGAAPRQPPRRPATVVAAPLPGRARGREAGGAPERPQRPARTRPVAHRPEAPADRARDGQPRLAVALRPGAGAVRGQLRPARRASRRTPNCSTGSRRSSSRTAGRSRSCTGASCSPRRTR